MFENVRGLVETVRIYLFERDTYRALTRDFDPDEYVEAPRPEGPEGE